MHISEHAVSYNRQENIHFFKTNLYSYGFQKINENQVEFICLW